MKYRNLQIGRQILSGILYVSLLSAVVACNEDYVEAPMEEVQLVNNVDVDITNLKLAKGMERTIKYTVLPANATDKEIVWKSTLESVATVTQDATIYAKEIGKSVITAASLWDALVSIDVEVVPVATSLRLQNIEMFNSTTLSMSELVKYVVVTPENGYKETFDVTSDNSAIVTIDNDGIKAVGEGTTTINIISKDGSNLRASAIVTVKPAIIPTDVTIASGQEFALEEMSRLDFTLTPSDATVELLKWKSSDESIVTVNERGYITTKKYGSADITAITPGGKEVKAQISVVKGKINDYGEGLSRYIKGLTDAASGTIQDGKLVISWKTGAKKLTNLVRGVTYVNADTYPILAIKTNGQVKGKGEQNVIWHNFDFYTPLNSQKLSMQWNQVLLTNDGNHVYYVNLQTNFGSIYTGKGEQEASRFTWQTGYDQNNGPEQTEISVYWLKSFKSLDELQSYIDSESK